MFKEGQYSLSNFLFPFTNPVILVPFICHPPWWISMNSAIVALNAVATGQGAYASFGR